MKNDKDSLGTRMKAYESVPRMHLTPRMPLIIRLDGCHFHTFTKGFERPFDPVLASHMTQAAIALVKEIQGAKLAYIQSDEISILLNDYETFDTQAWFDKNLQKMVSVSASIATANFNYGIKVNKLATFDSRAFVVPREDVANYFIWRQQDAVRNSISGLAQKHFSHKALFKKSQKDMIEMLSGIGISWADCETRQKCGWCVRSEKFTGLFIDYAIPDFKDDRDYVNRYLIQIE